jgi:hypothetical protein
MTASLDEVQEFLLNMNVGAEDQWQGVLGHEKLRQLELSVLDAEARCRGLHGAAYAPRPV